MQYPSNTREYIVYLQIAARSLYTLILELEEYFYTQNSKMLIACGKFRLGDCTWILQTEIIQTDPNFELVLSSNNTPL